MNKAELIDAVQKELGADCSKAHAERAVNSVLNSIGAGLERDSNVNLVGFGSFIVRERKARTGLNPQTKKPIEIPASKTVGFRPGAKLKDSL
ncbi:MAG: HU family DNA-binding protein [Planctomycetes bacterium]|nr:HU family DNA-binding protein [Planctomycetota bacterium]MCB9889849.1 HU family DNA-binding protein [Planctomycetota bacterium]